MGYNSSLQVSVIIGISKQQQNHRGTQTLLPFQHLALFSGCLGGKRQKNHNWGKFVWTAATHLGSLFPWFTFSISSTLSHSISPWGHLTWYGVSSEYTTALKLGDVNHIPSQAFTRYQTRIPISLCASQSQHNYHVNLPCGTIHMHMPSGACSQFFEEKRVLLAVPAEWAREGYRSTQSGSFIFRLFWSQGRHFLSLRLLVAKRDKDIHGLLVSSSYLWPFIWVKILISGQLSPLIYTQFNILPLPNLFSHFFPLKKIFNVLFLSS